MRERIAIVGGGVAGLTACYLLHERHEVTLFEKARRLGGNAYTYTTRDGEEVDIAAAVFGAAGYRNFFRLLAHLGIETRRCPWSYLSFHDLETGRGLYMTPGLRGLLCQRFGILAPSKIRSLLSLLGIQWWARRLLAGGRAAGLRVEEALREFPGLTREVRVVILSLFCLLSSMSGEEVLRAPAEFFLRKIRVHRDVLSPRAFLSIRAVANRTRSYVEALAAPYSERVHLGRGIQKVRRGTSRVTLRFEDGTSEDFDRVILATGADEALALLEDPTPDEAALLGAWRYKEGRIVVHRDYDRLPPRPLMQAYTFAYTGGAETFETSVNGGLWHEPGVSRGCDLVSSQHPNYPIRPDRIEFETVLRTPVFDDASTSTTRHLPRLSGARNTYYCGSYFGYGLHEDAVASALDVARRLGVDPPWRA
ncbi:MAG: FAD-dependent oxidoreductase [Planctomycetes bacterium]|nr:FAD-dependent oxidoreductase [Planctomycetota bacterium]